MYYGGGNLTQVNPANKPLTQDFVSLHLKGRTDGFALKGGDATKGTYVYISLNHPPSPPTPHTPSTIKPAFRNVIGGCACTLVSSRVDNLASSMFMLTCAPKWCDVIWGNNNNIGTFETMYDGPRPLLSFPGAVNDCHYHGVNGTFQPMRKQGAIILGTGGDNSNGAIGNFYEGVMATGVTSASVAIYYSTRQSTITTITTIPTPLGLSHLRLCSREER